MKNATTKAFGMVFAALIILTIWSSHSQQPQTQTAPIYAVNAKYTNGVGPGYWATKGSGLTLNLSAGTAFCSGSVVTYSGSTLSMTASTTNNIYLNTASSCVPATKTAAFVTNDIPIAQVITGSSTITSITDVRTPFVAGSASSAIPAVATTGAVNVMVATFTPAITSLTTGLTIIIIPNNTNTAQPTTVNVNGLGAKNITKLGSSFAAAIGDLVLNQPALLIYNGTSFDLQNPAAQLLVGAGSSGAPSHSFTTAPDYGMWVGSGALRFSRSGTDVLDVNINGITVNGSIGGNYGNFGVTTVGALGSASGHGAGTIIAVSDGSGSAGATCAGSGTNYQIALSNGTTWTCR